MGMSRWWDLSICDVCYMLFIGGQGICDVRYPGVCSSSMSARCCPMWVPCYCLSISDVYCWWAFVIGCVCSLDIVVLLIPTPIVQTAVNQNWGTEWTVSVKAKTDIKHILAVLYTLQWKSYDFKGAIFLGNVDHSYMHLERIRGTY